MFFDEGRKKMLCILISLTLFSNYGLKIGKKVDVGGIEPPASRVHNHREIQ